MPRWLQKIFGKSSTAPHATSDNDPGELASTLRHQALSTKRTEVGILATPPDAPVWGALMETGYPGATATLFTLSDGSTSLYLSSGFILIGGHAHENVVRANKAFIKQANKCYQQMMPCESFQFPETGQTIFYALTDSCILTANGLEDDLTDGLRQLSPLFFAGHEVIAQLREIADKMNLDA